MRTNNNSFKHSSNQKRKINSENEKLNSLREETLELLANGSVKKLPELTRRACSALGPDAEATILDVISSTDQFYSLNGDAEDYRKMTLQICKKQAQVGLKAYRIENAGLKEYKSPVGRSASIEAQISNPKNGREDNQ